MALVFDDVETTGLNNCFGQILKLSAIRTDVDFNEIEGLETRSRLIMSGALLTGLPAQVGPAARSGNGSGGFAA